VRCSSPRIIRLLRSVSWTKLRSHHHKRRRHGAKAAAARRADISASRNRVARSLDPDYQKTLTTPNEAAVHL
jgi:hypothetical protein